MKSRRFELGDVVVTAPPPWVEITEEVQAEDVPYTLARGTDGVGALQFSTALYSHGPVPSPSLEVLLEMVEEFGRRQSLGKPLDQATRAGPPMVAAADFRCDDDFIRVWYVSDRGNFALITYVCATGTQDREISECENIINSIE